MAGLRSNLAWAVVFASLSIGLVVAVFAIVGSPADMAKYRRDSQRVADLLRFANEMREHTRASASGAALPLPDRLPEQLNGRNLRAEWIDPLTRRPYRYRKLDADRYEVCATFELTFEEFERRGVKLPNARWRHQAGEHCVPFKLSEAPGEWWQYMR